MTDSILEAMNANLSAFSDAESHELRKQWTRQRNWDIANGGRTLEPFKSERVNLEQMLERCIYVMARDEVVMLPPDHLSDYGLRLASIPPRHFKNMTAGNLVQDGTRTNRHGDPVLVEAADLWLKDSERKNVTEAMYAIGKERFISSPSGDLSVNLWTPMKRRRVEADINIFHTHMSYIVPNHDDREKFLDWLAHCEQQPQVLPHYGWLFWTEKFGVGRNWLSSVLSRVWVGEVAPSLDLVALLGGTFNNALSCRRCAVVDEIHIGTNNSLFTLSARLRQIMTEEIRMINPKYGKMTAEYNTTRWLVFSNHDDALPIPEDDRRFEIVHNPEWVQPQEYYDRLYRALDDDEFIAGVSHFLASRDLSKFNPGARPRMTDAKRHIIKTSTPQLERDAQETVKKWKDAGVKMFCSSDLIRDIGATPQQSAAFHHVLKRLKVVPLGRQNLSGVPERFFLVDAAAEAEMAAQQGERDAMGTELFATWKERIVDGRANGLFQGPQF
jgi:hypothetical protein